jgi:receptor protein-tyrosine kinase
MNAQLGKRTLLIDADFRHPIQHRLFGLSGAGLSEVVSGGVGGDAIQSIATQPELAVLSAGEHFENAADLLARPQFAHLLRDMATRFDAIVVDTPAMSESADAQIIAACTGAALIVALTAVGFATFFLGLIVLTPIIGHATWHAYRDLVEQQSSAVS